MGRRKSRVFVKKTDNKVYYNYHKNTYTKSCNMDEQPYYWYQGIGDITGTPSDIMAHVAYLDELWHGMNLLQGDLGMVDPDGDFTVDAEGYLQCTRPDADKYSIDQSTAQLVYQG